MEFSAKTLYNIMLKNFNLTPVEDDAFEFVIDLPSLEAFRYATITNSNFLFNEYGYSPFGKMVTFNHRDYSLNPGMFGTSKEIKLMNAPLKLYNKYPKLLEGNKKLIFLDVSNQNVDSNVYKKLRDLGRDPSNYLLTKVKSDGSDLEHFFEFIAYKIFSHKGFFCETQIPWSYHGRPDFGAYKSPIFNDLQLNGLVSAGGLIIDLSLIFLGKKERPINLKSNYEIIIGEVKTKQKNSQILDYMKVGLADKGLEIMPSKIKPSPGLGLLSFDNEFNIKLTMPKESFSLSTIKEKDALWFEDYIKSFLLCNFDESTLLDMYTQIKNASNKIYYDVINLIKAIQINKLVELLTNKYGI